MSFVSKQGTVKKHSFSSNSSQQLKRTWRVVGATLFNPTISTKEETAHENVITFCPPSTPLNTQMNEIGLCSGMGGLACRFSDRNVSCITTNRKRYIVQELEPNFFYAVVTERPERVRGLDDRDDDALPLRIVTSVLDMLYGDYKWVHGTLQALLTKVGLDTFRHEVTENTADQWLSVLDAALGNCYGSFGLQRGVDYIPMSTSGYLAASSFIAGIERAHPGAIRGSALYHGHNLCVSTLSIEATMALKRLVSAKFSQCREGVVGFVDPPLFVHIPPEHRHETPQEDTAASILLYAVQSFRFVFLVEAKYLWNDTLSTGFHHSIQHFIHKDIGKLDAVAKDGQEGRLSSRSLDKEYTYYYENDMNGATKTSIAKTSNAKGAKEGRVYAMDTMRHHLVQKGDSGEVVMRYKDDTWVSCLWSGERELSVAVDGHDTPYPAFEELNKVTSLISKRSGMFME